MALQRKHPTSALVCFVWLLMSGAALAQPAQAPQSKGKPAAPAAGQGMSIFQGVTQEQLQKITVDVNKVQACIKEKQGDSQDKMFALSDAGHKKMAELCETGKRKEADELWKKLDEAIDDSEYMKITRACKEEFMGKDTHKIPPAAAKKIADAKKNRHACD